MCTLFHGREKRVQPAKYTYKICYIAEFGSGVRVLRLHNDLLGTMDSPSANLSGHLEQLLLVMLNQLRMGRSLLAAVLIRQLAFVA